MKGENLFLRRPGAPPTPAAMAAFDRLYSEAVSGASGGWIDYNLPHPKWQFFCHLTDHKGVLAHGSGAPDIAEFEPRKSNDVLEFGDQRAVYAASDGIWAMYFAIVDRPRAVTSLLNGCFHYLDDADHEPRYFFSINEDAFSNGPWREGTVYLLPGESFEAQLPFESHGRRVMGAQLRSPESVRPLAKISVQPSDFPFLEAVAGHDPKVIEARAKANPDGFPWMSEG